MQIVPSVDAKYKKSDTLELIYWIYGMQVDAAGKPDITIENAFNQKTAEGEKFFNKTQPQALNAQSPYMAAAGVPNFLETHPEPLARVMALMPDQPPRRFEWRGKTYKLVATA